MSLTPLFEGHPHPPIQIAGGNLHFNKAIIAFLVNGHTRLLPWPLPYGFAAPPHPATYPTCSTGRCPPVFITPPRVAGPDCIPVCAFPISSRGRRLIGGRLGLGNSTD